MNFRLYNINYNFAVLFMLQNKVHAKIKSFTVDISTTQGDSK